MALGSISTYVLFQSTLNDVNKLATNMANQQMQLSSGMKSDDFAGIAGQARQFLALDNTIAKSQQYINDNQVIETRVNTTASVMSQIIESATSLQNLIMERRSGTSNTAAFANQLRGLWQNIAGQLNTAIGGRYLFSGTKTDTAPVDASTFPTLIKDGVPDSGYYHGSPQDMTVRADDNVEFIYNVRADASGFQKLVAGLAMAMKGDSGNDDDLKAAYNLVQEGLKDIISSQATVNANKVALSKINDGHQSLKLYWTGIKESIGNTDIVSVSTQLAVNQGILQGTFQAFAKINSLRLSDYLK